MQLKIIKGSKKEVENKFYELFISFKKEDINIKEIKTHYCGIDDPKYILFIFYEIY